MKVASVSERALVLAPQGRDAAIAAGILAEARVEALVCASLPTLIDELDQGAGMVIATEEALAAADLHALRNWIDEQPEWSDLPILLLTSRGGGLERNPAAGRYLALLGNVTFLERPFHPTTLVSVTQAALRGRRRQYEARSRLMALRESEARLMARTEQLEAVYAAAPIGLTVLDTELRFVRINDRLAEMNGLPAADHIGRTVREVLPDLADEAEAVMRRVLTGESLYGLEFVGETRAQPGVRRVWRENWLPLHDAAGNVTGITISAEEITHEKAAADALKASEARLRELNETLERRVADALAERRLLADIVEGTDALVQVADRDFRWLSINKAAADEWQRLYGVRPVVGASMLTLLMTAPADRDALQALWSRALAGEEFTEVVELGARLRRSYEMKFNTLRDAHGEPLGAYQFVYDVTERMRREEELEAARAQLHEAQKLETLGQLTGGVAHDMNNLLTPIMGALDLINRQYGESDSRAARLVEGALQSAERAKLLVSRLLGFARRQTLETRPVDIARLIDGMRDLLRSSIGASIELKVSVANGLSPALADPNQLELAILNLCVNARDAMPDGGVLTIVVDRAQVEPSRGGELKPGPYIRLSVIDSGVGMDTATLRRAVEPFFSTKGTGKGTGLGLSMVHGYGAQLGGAFMLSSAPGKGTRADLYLPFAEAPEQSAPREPPARPTSGRSLTLLLVDDEELVRIGTAEMLRDLGHVVHEASGGLQALRRLAEGLRVDAVLTDYMMPRINGAEVAHRLQEKHPQLPVLVITGYAGGDIIHDLPQLSKPFTQADIAAALDILTSNAAKRVSAAECEG